MDALVELTPVMAVEEFRVVRGEIPACECAVEHDHKVGYVKSGCPASWPVGVFLAHPCGCKELD